MRETDGAGRRGLVAASAAVDGVVLALLLGAGWTWIDAQLTSFLAGLLALAALTTLARRGAEPAPTRPSLLADALVAVLVLAVRGGLLATLVRLGLDTTPWLVAAALLTWPCAAWCRSGLAETWRAEGTGGDASVVRLAMTFAAVSLLLRVVYLFPVELMHEEAYYWLYGKHLDYGYSDHPPFIGVMTWLGTWIAGNTELGVRLLAPLFWAGGAAFVFALTRRIFDRTTAWVAVALFAVLPFFFFAGYIAFPDTPLIFCWAGCAYFLHRMLVDDAPRAWLGVGVFLGLGLLAKFTIGLLGVAAVLFAATHPRTRRVFVRWQSYAALAVALLLLSPLLAWNANHEWASLTRQTSERVAAGFKFMLPVLLLFVGVILTPIGLLGVGRTLRAWWRERRAPVAEQADPVYRARQLAVWLVLVPLAVFVLASLFRNTKFNWTAPIWIPLLPFIAASLLRPATASDAARGRRIARHPAGFAVGLLVFFALSLYHLGLGIPGVPYTRGLSGVGWRGLGVRVEAMANERTRPDGSRPYVVGINRDTTPSWLTFYRCVAAAPEDEDRAIAETIGGHLWHKPSGMFKRWFPLPESGLELDELLLVSDDVTELQGPRCLHWVERADPILEIPLEKNGRAAGAYYVRWVYGYRGP